MTESNLIRTRRREATRTFYRYFCLVFAVVLLLSCFTAYAVIDARHQQDETRAIRMAYCTELEKLKKQNRDEVEDSRREFEHNVKLLGIVASPELREAAQARWDRTLRRNSPRPCPYTS